MSDIELPDDWEALATARVPQAGGGSELYVPESYGDIEVDLPAGERAHAVLGASGSERWMNCPGSIRMSEGMPNKSSIYAMEGTAAHHLGELCLMKGERAEFYEGMYMTYRGELLDEEPEIEYGENIVHYDGMVLSATNPAFPIDNMIPHINRYLDTIDYYMDWARETYLEEPILLVEKAFDLSVVYPDMFGTNDVCIWIPGKCLIVIDYKHGRGKVVQIKNNSQLKYYGLGALIEMVSESASVNIEDLTLDTIVDHFHDTLPEKVVTVIVQPRAAHKDGPVRAAEYDTREIAVTFRDELIAAAEATKAPDAPLNPGAWCFFCAGKTRCPKIVSKFQEIAAQSLQKTYGELSAEDLMMPGDRIAKFADDVTNDPERLARFLDLAPIIEDAIEAVRELAILKAENGMRIPGWKLARKDTKRKYADPMAAAKDIHEKTGLPYSEIMDMKLKAQSNLKKLGVKKWRPIEQVLIEGNHVIKPEGALTIVPEDDIRDEVVPNAYPELDADDLMIAPPLAEDGWDF